MNKELTSRVEHVVVLMLENRSFDHMLGTLPGVDGVLNTDGAVRPECYNVRDPLDGSSERFDVKVGAPYFVPKVQLSGPGGEYGGPSHSFPAATEQLFGTKTVGKGNAETTPFGSKQAPDTTPSHNSGFVRSFIGELTYSAHVSSPGAKDIQEVMNVFGRQQVPAITKLAEEFCVCDRWFSELPGPTEPNRLFMHAATSTGLTYNPWKLDIVNVPTIYDRLDSSGHDWASYGYHLFDTANFKALRKQKRATLPIEQFYEDAQQGRLPFYSFLCPLYSDSYDERANSEHAPHDVRYGEHYIARVYKALRSSTKWDKTLLIVLYDEHGGYYDHVTPPAVSPPDANRSPNAFMKREAEHAHRDYLTKPDYNFDFSSLGFRVPAVIVSPWIKKGTIDSTEYRHTSVLAFVERMLGLDPLTKRDASANSFEKLLQTETSARTDCPAELPTPPLPDVTPGDTMQQAPSAKAVELARRYTANLDGHPDSGREPPTTFATNEELWLYVTARITAHRSTQVDACRPAAE